MLKPSSASRAELSERLDGIFVVLLETNRTNRTPKNPNMPSIGVRTLVQARILNKRKRNTFCKRLFITRANKNIWAPWAPHVLGIGQKHNLLVS